MTNSLPSDFVLFTPRCVLRRPAESDIPHVFSATRIPGFNDGLLWDPPETIEDLIIPYRKSIEAWEAGTSYSFSFYDRACGEFFGRISIRKTDARDVWDIGFWTHPRLQAKGYMTEAACEILRLGFEKLGATRIEACHADWNDSSRRVLEKIGMKFVRHIPEGFLKGGVWVAESLFAIGRSDWATKNQSPLG